jgi:hypothetical protein
LFQIDREFDGRPPTAAALGQYAGGYTDMLSQRAAESRGSPPPKTRNIKRSRPATQTSELPGGLPRRMTFNDRRALDLLLGRITAGGADRS